MSDKSTNSCDILLLVMVLICIMDCQQVILILWILQLLWNMQDCFVLNQAQVV